MAKIIVVNKPPWCYTGDVKIDGQPLDSRIFPENIIEGEFIQFDIPCRATARRYAWKEFRLRPGEIYVLLYEDYNAHAAPSIKKIEGAEKVYEYGDAHGMRWAALLRLTADRWLVDYDVPGHHGHYWHRKRVVGDKEGWQDATFERLKEEAPEV